MRALFAAIALMTVATAHAQVVAVTSRGHVVVARSGRIELFGESQRRIWSVAGVENPSKVVAGDDRVMVIDSFANVVVVADVQSGRSERVETAETPIDGLFAGRHVFLLERDARALERIGRDGARASLAVAADPAFLRHASGLLYVYSRLEGVIQEISPDPLRITRRAQIAPFASDFETDGRIGYFAYPAEGKLRTFNLASMTSIGEVDAGAVPVDLTIVRASTALSAPRLAVADPAAKRVWNIEGPQSLGAAIGRGFLRGLLGLGLAPSRSSQFPTGIDRVITSELAYDSSSGTVYRLHGSRSEVLAKGVGSQAFAAFERGVAVWQDGTLRIIR